MKILYSRVMKSNLLLALAAMLLVVVPAAAQQFPNGPGKDILDMKCSMCHGPDQVLSGGGRTPDEWADVVRQMIDLGAGVSDTEMPVLVEYLAKNWPLKKADAPASVASANGGAPTSTGNTPVTFKEWEVPTPNSRPHDPLAASDGTIWYTGMGSISMKPATR